LEVIVLEDNRRSQSFDVMLRRFFRDVQQSGILTDIKKRRYREKKITRTRQREIARRKSARRKVKRGF
jgi:ribosomal protein S21